MRVRFFDKEMDDNPLNGAVIGSGEELLAILDQLRHRKPFGLELASEHGFSLDICLAETYGAVQHIGSDGGSSYLLAVAPGRSPIFVPPDLSPHAVAFNDDRQNGVESPEFLVGGTATPVPTRYILPYDLVRNIAVHFLETGERQSDVTWEQI